MFHWQQKLSMLICCRHPYIASLCITVKAGPTDGTRKKLQFFWEIRHRSMKQFHEHPIRHPFFVWEPRYSGASSCGGSKLNSKAYKPPRPFNPHSLHQSITLRCKFHVVEKMYGSKATWLNRHVLDPGFVPSLGCPCRHLESVQPRLRVICTFNYGFLG